MKGSVEIKVRRVAVNIIAVIALEPVALSKTEVILFKCAFLLAAVTVVIVFAFFFFCFFLSKDVFVRSALVYIDCSLYGTKNLYVK